MGGKHGAYTKSHPGERSVLRVITCSKPKDKDGKGGGNRGS